MSTNNTPKSNWATNPEQPKSVAPTVARLYLLDTGADHRSIEFKQFTEGVYEAKANYATPFLPNLPGETLQQYKRRTLRYLAQELQAAADLCRAEADALASAEAKEGEPCQG